MRLAAAKMGTAGSVALVRPAVCLDLACSECVRQRERDRASDRAACVVYSSWQRRAYACCAAARRMRSPVDREALIRMCGANAKVCRTRHALKGLLAALLTRTGMRRR